MQWVSRRRLCHGGLIATTAVGILATWLAIGRADEDSGYYDDAQGKTGEELRLALHEIIDDHTRFSYTGSGTDTWDIVAEADEDPSNTSRVRTIYKNKSAQKSDHSQGSGWNREHSWPNSYGFSQDDGCNMPYTDCHQLFAADWGYNTARGNRPYDWVVSGGTEYPVDDFPASSNFGFGSGPSNGEWEVWTERRGDVARAIFYLDVRYEGGNHGGTGCSEPDLIITGDRSLIQSDSQNNFSPAYMGLLDILLEWHQDDPPDAREQRRNDVVCSYQGNRNPFIDHPEWVAEIWGTPPPPPEVDVWVNELHYDNSGSDTGEFVEVAGAAGTDLNGYTVVFYNGSGGASYGSVSLTGVLPDQDDGYGTAWFSFTGIQNGAPDGFALIAPDNSVVQFLSYEGDFTATNGVAAGLRSVDILVEESGSTPVGWSLRLVGTGSRAADFDWAVPAPESPGQPNADQDFLPDDAPPAPPTGLTAGPTDGRVVLRWNDSPELDLDGYLVHRSDTSGGGYVQLTPSPIAASAYDDLAVLNGETYYYVVTAVDLAGQESLFSDEVDATPNPLARPRVWINELHYDDVGVDRHEGFELAGPAGTTFLGWSVIPYNGGNGQAVDVIPLAGSIPAQQAGYGTRWFAYRGLQNGSPDGLALVDSHGDVLEFVSWEGTFTAVNGPAAGQTSTDLGVSEGPGTPNGWSLQVSGDGTRPWEQSWQSPAPHSRGFPNPGQSF